MRSLCRGLLVLGCIVLLGACSESEEANPTVDLKQLSVLSVTGQSQSLDAYQGKTLVVNFWASWCPPCVAELPALQRLQQRLPPGQFQVLLISVDADPLKAQQQLQQLNVSLPAFYDPQMQLANGLFQLQGYPETLILSSEGLLLERILGARDWDDPDVFGKIVDLSPLKR